jgi:thioredoxin-like negative regulator of GroEL
MERLDDQAALTFAIQSDTAVVLFGGPEGSITAIQAGVFADLWADHANEARFGYVDAVAHPEVRSTFMIRALPAILVFRDGDLIESFEGFCPHARIASALRRRPADEAVAQAGSPHARPPRQARSRLPVLANA